ncbi:MAG: chemotaxis protein CheW [Candidatus Schekmanbacteria bacterium]|nr:chemotaxis protein CheW [Candidatus Schekmanbacteria bacterium]
MNREAPSTGLALTHAAPSGVAARLEAANVVLFALEGRLYGLEILSLDEITMMPAITFVPRSPSFYLGITSARGRIVPIVDLRRRMNMPPRSPDKMTRVIVVRPDEEPVGLVVDSVIAVTRLDLAAVEPPPATLPAATGSFLSGIVRMKSDEIVSLLNLTTLLPVE